MEQVHQALKALVDKNRLIIISLLQQHDLCVNVLASRLNISEAAVSQHLKILREAGFVTGEKRGYFTHYRVAAYKLKETAENLMNLSELLPDTFKECNVSSCCCHTDSKP